MHNKLRAKAYRHGSYSEFYVNDPKRRHIHKAQVYDRIVHHFLYKYLYEIFYKTFIFDSYSCRLQKGTHRAVDRLEKFARIVSKNYIRDCWALKCDIRKFFASVDHMVLKKLIAGKVKDKNILWLIDQVINSFSTGVRPLIGVEPLKQGIPLGNLTSQIFANIYMNEVDQFIKHKLGAKYYLRYADDFTILSQNKESLEEMIEPIARFLKERLKLEMHPNKIIFRRLNWGIDFLGYVVLPHYRVARTRTRRRIFRKLQQKFDSPNLNQSLQSYLGYLNHANSYKLTQELKNYLWFTANI